MCNVQCACHRFRGLLITARETKPVPSSRFQSNRMKWQKRNAMNSKNEIKYKKTKTNSRARITNREKYLAPAVMMKSYLSRYSLPLSVRHSFPTIPILCSISILIMCSILTASATINPFSVECPTVFIINASF